MRDTAKQIINYWYSLECLQPKDVPPYKAISNRNDDELIVHIKIIPILILIEAIKPLFINSL